jgi:hypothetical protein
MYERQTLCRSLSFVILACEDQFQQSVESKLQDKSKSNNEICDEHRVKGVVAFVAVLDERFEEHGLGVSSPGLELLPRISKMMGSDSGND